jgi:hypothetical protein
MSLTKPQPKRRRKSARLSQNSRVKRARREENETASSVSISNTASQAADVKTTTTPAIVVDAECRLHIGQIIAMRRGTTRGQGPVKFAKVLAPQKPITDRNDRRVWVQVDFSNKAGHAFVKQVDADHDVWIMHPDYWTNIKDPNTFIGQTYAADAVTADLLSRPHGRMRLIAGYPFGHSFGQCELPFEYGTTTHILS